MSYHECLFEFIRHHNVHLWGKGDDWSAACVVDEGTRSLHGKGVEPERAVSDLMDQYQQWQSRKVVG